MKLQQFISKVEELRALVNLYEELRGRVAQVSAYEVLTDSEQMDEEQKAQFVATASQLRERHDASVRLLTERFGVSDIDAAVERMDEIQARVEQIHATRREHVNLRATLDLELALGQVTAEQRQQAESALGQMIQRMEMGLARAEQLLPSARIVQVLS